VLGSELTIAAILGEPTERLQFEAFCKGALAVNLDARPATLPNRYGKTASPQPDRLGDLAPNACELVGGNARLRGPYSRRPRGHHEWRQREASVRAAVFRSWLDLFDEPMDSEVRIFGLGHQDPVWIGWPDQGLVLDDNSRPQLVRLLRQRIAAVTMSPAVKHATLQSL
jgi:hypothetical protein